MATLALVRLRKEFRMRLTTGRFCDAVCDSVFAKRWCQELATSKMSQSGSGQKSQMPFGTCVLLGPAASSLFASFGQACFLSIRQKDLQGFERHVSQLKMYYNDDKAHASQWSSIDFHLTSLLWGVSFDWLEVFLHSPLIPCSP